MRKLTITEGLAELKLLNSRIEKAIVKDFVWSAKKADMTESDNEEMRKVAEANYQSVTDLISNRNAIKAAIVKSNATTVVKVADKEMTVAEAIERKSSIEYEKDLLLQWKQQLTSARNNVERQNIKAQEKIDMMLSQIAASNRTDVEEAQKVVSDTYMANNGWGLFDPLNLPEKIDELDKSIDEFEKNVDIALSMSNAVTYIEI